jgi:hypothetical protein
MLTRLLPRRLASASGLTALLLVALVMVAVGLCFTEAGQHEGHDHGMTQHVCALMLVAMGAPLLVVILALGGEVAVAASPVLIVAPLSVLDPPPRRAPLSL